MAKELLRLTERIHNTPHLITQTSFDNILSYLEARNSGNVRAFYDEDDYVEEPDEDGGPEMVEGIGVINVHGGLSYKPVYGLCGEVGCSYVSIQKQAEELIEAGCSTIVLDFASGGGEASHAFQYANYLRQLCDSSGVSLVSYIDEMAASAAYAYACIADEVVINPSATAGSIGCVVSLLDTSKAMDNMGLKRIFITSGKNKVPFDAEGRFKAEFLAEMQKEVDRLNMQFAEHVSKYTGLDVETIMSFEAGLFNAEDALEKGLVNKIMGNMEFAQYITEKNKNKRSM